MTDTDAILKIVDLMAAHRETDKGVIDALRRLTDEVISLTHRVVVIENYVKARVIIETDE